MIAPASTTETAHPRPPHTARVLVVDDEPLVCRVVADCLRAGGFEVTTVTDWRSAADVLACSPGMFRLALIDLRLPGQDGAALAARLQALAPGLAVVLMTADGIAPLRGQRGCFAGYLRKPFRADDLLGEVRRALCRAA